MQRVSEGRSPGACGIARAGRVAVLLIHRCGRAQVVLNPGIAFLYRISRRLPWSLHRMLVGVIRKLGNKVHEITFLLNLPDIAVAHSAPSQRVPNESMMRIRIPQAQRIGSSGWIVTGIGIESAVPPSRVFAQESAR